ncbi:MAG TPA: hypothetical protein VKX17_01240 [Planctomycetota bacterium]|nr:hypothetical protein [Planctomycetota bacterium]
MLVAGGRRARRRPRQTARKIPRKTGAGDYVWGELVFGVEVKSGRAATEGALAKVQSGDIVQFRDTRFEGRKGRGTYWQDAPHHTAIVTAISKDGQLTVLHQNWEGNRTVHELTYNVGDIKKGWIKIYRAGK